MEEFNLWELFNEHPEVFEAHAMLDSEREPYFEEPSPTVLLPPWGDYPINDCYTVY